MVPPKRRANDPIEATGQDLDHNPNNPQENVDNVNLLQVTQDDTPDNTQLMRVLQESNAQVMRTMQENTRALNQFVAMFAQIQLPCNKVQLRQILFLLRSNSFLKCPDLLIFRLLLKKLL